MAPDRTLQLVGPLAGPITNLGLGNYGMRLGIAGINAQRDVGLSTNQAFQALGAGIGAAATHGYQFIQAPAPNIGGSVVGGDQVGDCSGTNSGNSGTISGADIEALLPLIVRFGAPSELPALEDVLPALPEILTALAQLSAVPRDVIARLHIAAPLDFVCVCATAWIAVNGP